MFRFKRSWTWISACCVMIGLSSAVQAQPPGGPPTAPPFEPPPLQHSLLDFLTGHPVAMKMKELRTPKLMRPPFAGAPVNTPKGLAAQIKAQQVDAQNRAAAVEFLGTVDCVAHPEARDMLLQVLQEDPSEEVRYAAAQALQEMLSRGRQRGRPGFFARMGSMFDGESDSEEARRYDYCRGCCDTDLLNALSEIAYGQDETGCPIEPSQRVREALREAMRQCAQCYPAQYAPGQPIEPTPDQLEEAPQEAPGEEAPGEEAPTEASYRHGPTIGHHRHGHPRTVQAVQASHSAGNTVTPQFIRQQAARSENPPIQALRGYCVVGLKERRFEKARADLASVYKGHTYYFADKEAKRKFDENPEKYSVAYGGMDPVHYARTGESRQGIYLREHDDRFYLFLTKENWRVFQEHTDQFVPISIYIPTEPSRANSVAENGLARQ